MQSESITAPGPAANVWQTFGYDKLNRLTSAIETPLSGSNTTPWGVVYDYDRYGNRWLDPSSYGLSLSPFTPQFGSNFNANNQLLVQNSTYDPAGNQQTIGGFTYTYDAENRLSLVTEPTGTNPPSYQYFYDGEGRRVQKVASGGSTTTYVYDAQGGLAAEYVSGTVPAAPCATCYLVQDTLGSTRMMLDASTGTPVALHDYLPFGEEIVNARPGSLYSGINDPRQKFTGKERDAETGLDFFSARYFSGAQGRFTSPDPEIGGGHLPDPQSWNMYSYGRNNPLLYTDPDGRNYTVCDSTGANCSNLTDPQYNQYLASIQDSNISVSPGGNINYQNADGSVTTTGSATYYNERAENAVGFLNFGITTLALNYLELAGPLINSFRAGRAFIAIGLAGAAESAGVAVRAAEISGVVAKAAAAVGNESVQASSRAVAEGAAKEFIGPGSRPIFSRATGQAVGEVSADGSKIARYTSADKAQPYINLENKATGGNLHVRW